MHCTLYSYQWVLGRVPAEIPRCTSPRLLYYKTLAHENLFPHTLHLNSMAENHRYKLFVFDNQRIHLKITNVYRDWLHWPKKKKKKKNNSPKSGPDSDGQAQCGPFQTLGWVLHTSPAQGSWGPRLSLKCSGKSTRLRAPRTGSIRALSPSEEAAPDEGCGKK